MVASEVEGLKWGKHRDGVDPQPDPACSDHGADGVRYIVQFRHAMGLR
jgi:hypothetical protein